MKPAALVLRWSIFALIAIGGGALDLWSKAAVFAWRGIPGTEDEPFWIVKGFFGIETAVNEGALFGMGAGWGSVFATLSVVAGIGILVWLSRYGAIESWWLIVALACVMAGIFGNLYDRLGLWWQAEYPIQWRSGVRDWILFRYKNYTWPNFNIADSLLVTGAIMLALHAYMTPPAKDASKTDTSKPSSQH